MKTRIIQAEPEAKGEVAEVPTEEVSMTERNRTWLRRGVIFAAVAGYFVIGVIHPPDLYVGDDATVHYWLHVVQPVFIGLLAWGLWLLVDDVPGRAAKIARYAVVPFLIAYTTLDAIAGIATGMIVRAANGMNAADAAVVDRAMDDMGGEIIPVAIWLASGLTWFVAALATALAVKQIGGRGPAILMILGAAVFAVGHPFPPGPIGITLFGLGVAWLELRRARAPVPEAQPVLVP